MPNIAWVEKGRGERERRPFSPAPVNGSMNRAELLKIHLPVHSRLGGGHLRQNGPSLRGISLRTTEADSDNSKLRWIDDLIKVMNVYSKDAASD
jgi:hypothetical protein